jgi:7,8-dihydroneopterin aldolase/epimerase/oxygenase
VADQLTVAVEGIALRGRCGVTAEERAVGQSLVIDVRLTPRATRAPETDDLADTVDYGRVVDAVRDVVEGGEFDLLERLATVVADRVWTSFTPAELHVAVAKLAPPVSVPVAAARVEVTRRA